MSREFVGSWGFWFTIQMQVVNLHWRIHGMSVNLMRRIWLYFETISGKFNLFDIGYDLKRSKI